MRGRGLSKTMFANMDLDRCILFGEEEIELSEAYGLIKDENDNISGQGILVCYDGDLNDVLELYHLEPLVRTIIDGDIKRFVLSNGVAALKLTSIIRYEDVKSGNYVNAFNNGIDVIHIRKNFDKLADPDLFWDTVLPQNAYNFLKSLFHGGVMNAYAGVYANVKSGDLVSAHASNIVNKTYPLGKFEKCYMPLENLIQIRKLKDIFYIGNVIFKNIRLKSGFIATVVTHHGASLNGVNVDETQQGYLKGADSITLAVTETYMEIIDMCYDYDEAVGLEMYWCLEGGKLPDNMREYVLDKFNNKQTKPKGTKEYEEAKLLVNFSYGFLARKTESFTHYTASHKLKYPFQWGVYTCLYTTHRIVTEMKKVIEKGGEVVSIATDSIKYVGDFDLEWGTELGDLKYEGEYDMAYVETPYRAIYKKGDKLDIKLAGCLKEKAEAYFSTHPARNISMRDIKISQGIVSYEYNPQTSRIEPVFFDYTLQSI